MLYPVYARISALHHSTQVNPSTTTGWRWEKENAYASRIRVTLSSTATQPQANGVN